MNKYTIIVSRDWREYGRLTVEAEDIEEAREWAREALVDDGDNIEWDADMSILADNIESIKKEDSNDN